MTVSQPFVSFLLLLGLGFFFGLAFEEFHAQGSQVRPGGVRSFPLLALSGALLYQLDAARLLPLTAGLLVLGAWLTCYYWRHVAETDAEGRPNVGLMVPICNVLAYLLGPIALTEPPWTAIGVTVVAVLLLTAREKLHGLARRLEIGEIVTAGKFLILTGLVNISQVFRYKLKDKFAHFQLQLVAHAIVQRLYLRVGCACAGEIRRPRRFLEFAAQLGQSIGADVTVV